METCAAITALLRHRAEGWVDMGLIIKGRNGRTGQVIIQDDRPHGASVIFVCDILEGFNGGIVVPSENSAYSEAPPPPPSTGRGGFPIFDNLPYDAAEPFELRVDTSQLNAQPTFFVTGKFIDRAVRAVDEGRQVVAISEENAQEWGRVNPQTKAAPAMA